MNFLSSALNLLSANSIPYTIKEKVVDPSQNTYPDSRSVWTVYNGVNPKNDTPVSVFEFNLKDPAAAAHANLARNCHRKLKSIKFPGVVGIVDFVENDAFLYIVTERVTPLLHYLRTHGSRVSPQAKLYGAYSVGRAVEFLNAKANCMLAVLDVASSVYVNAQGEWKLFDFSLLTNLTSDPDQPVYRLSAAAPAFADNLPAEVASRGPEAARQNPFSLDAYRYGVFLVSLFNLGDFSAPVAVAPSSSGAASFASKSGSPKQFGSCVMKLLSPVSARITVERFLQETESFFAANPLVRFSSALEQIKFASQAEKLPFFKHEVCEYLDGEFPPGFLDNKVLPEIVDQFNIVAKTKATAASPEEAQSRQETTSVLLNYILKLSSGLTDDAFAQMIKPVLFFAFTLSDRSVRLALLKHLPEYCRLLTDAEVQAKVFLPLLTGFQDTNFLIRETTLTSITTIIDKVSVKQVNQDLLKILAKSQMDPKPSIRTNTLILIIKISSKIYANSRNNVVITALSKSLRDSFTPCKLSALSGFEKLIDTFTLEEICAKVLGHLAISLMDPKSYKVRQESKRIFQLYLDSVEKHAASLPHEEEDEDAEEKEFYKTVSGTPGSAEKSAPEPASAMSLGWNVMSKLVSSEPSMVKGTLNSSFNSSTPDLTRISTPTLETPPFSKPTKSSITEQWDDDVDLDDGWDDGAGDFAPAPPKAAASRPAMSFGATSVKPSSAKSTSSTLNSRKTGLKLSSAKEPKKPSMLKLDLNVSDEDSWGNEW